MYLVLIEIHVHVYYMCMHVLVGPPVGPGGAYCAEATADSQSCSLTDSVNECVALGCCFKYNPEPGLPWCYCESDALNVWFELISQTYPDTLIALYFHFNQPESNCM